MITQNEWNSVPQETLDALAASLMPIEMLKEQLVHNEKGHITQIIENCETVVREDTLLKGAVQLNNLTGRLEIQKDMGWSRAGPTVNDNDMNNILSYMARNYDLRADKLCWRAITTAAYENGFHPIRDYLEGLEWDGQERIRHALRHFLGAPEDELTYQCMKMFMIGALRRVYEPGCKFEYVLTLVGGQGIGKSTFFRFLAIQDKWFTDDLVGFKSSRIFEKISGQRLQTQGVCKSASRTGPVELEIRAGRLGSSRCPRGDFPESLIRENQFCFAKLESHRLSTFAGHHEREGSG